MARAFGIGLLMVAFAFFAGTLGLSPAARRTPIVVSGLLVTLLIVYLVRDHARRSATPGETKSTPRTDRIALTLAMLWTLLLPAGIQLVGLYAGIALFVFGFAVGRGRERVGIAIALAATLTTLVWILVERVLALTAPTGELWRWLGLA